MSPESNSGDRSHASSTPRRRRSFSPLAPRTYKPKRAAKVMTGGAALRKQNTRPTTRHNNNDTHYQTRRRTTNTRGYHTRDNGSHATHANDERPKRTSVALPPVPPNAVRVIPLGGVEEVGKNMIAIETADDIIVSDVGFQFISDEDAPGVDYVLPNTTYLEERKGKIRAVFITHGHLDHIGGIPFIMDRIGNPPIYTQYLTSLMIKKRQEEYPHLPPLQFVVMEPGERVRVGNLHVKSFPVTHSIQDSMGLSVETEHGNVVISGDLKLEHDDGVPTEKEEKVWSEIGKGNNIIFIADSTNAEKDGFSIPETRVYDTIEEIIKNVPGRVIIGTFSSQFERMIHIIHDAEKYGKKVVTEGRSIRNNVDIARLAERLKPKEGTIIRAEEIDNYPADKIVIIATGAQGEEFGALMRIATGKHKSIRFTERDTIVLSSSVIPGNELAVQKLKDNLYRHGVRLIHYRSSDVHSTGHGNTGELVWMRKKVNPKFFMPAYGYHSMLRCHAQANIDAGFPKENIVLPDNGTLIDLVDGKEMIVRKEKAPSSLMMVDGFAIGDIQEVVIRDRKSLSQDGMFVIIATLNIKTGKLRKSPDIISRGFVYLRESQDLLAQTRIIVKKTVEESTEGMHPINFDFVKNSVTDAVARFLFQKTNKRPIVIPVVLGV